MEAVRYCKYCGKEIVRRDNEANGNFKIRKFCDRKCSNSANQKEKRWS